MGNFYTNVVVRESDVDRVVSALESLRRRAYVVATDNTSVVYDERCDDQDLDELQKLAGKLSEQLGAPALAFCNHDDDVLWYALADGGKIVDTYDSCPGYFDGGPRTPTGGDAARLCAAFGVSEKRSEVEALLRQEKSAITFEVERHQRLLALLGLPESALLGYGYVSRGELADRTPDARLRTVGGASTVDGPSRGEASEQVQIDPAVLAAIETESADMLANAAALVFAEVDVPKRFESVLPSGRVNGYAIFLHVQRYLVSHRLLKGLMVHPDEALARIVGPEVFAHIALTRKLREALGVPPLSTADAAALKRNDVAFLLRFHTAMRQAGEAARGK